MSTASRWPMAIPFILICQTAGVIGVLTTETGNSPWFRALAKPSFQPPGSVFGPVWTTLYVLMGIAAWRIWRLGMQRPGVRRALGLFAVQLVLNGVWSPIFFGAHAIRPALAVLAALWLVLALTIAAFRRLDGPAALLLVPYLAWVTFATLLNAAIVALN